MTTHNALIYNWNKSFMKQYSLLLYDALLVFSLFFCQQQQKSTALTTEPLKWFHYSPASLTPHFEKQNPREILPRADQKTGRLADALFVITTTKNWKQSKTKQNNPKVLSTGDCIRTFVIICAEWNRERKWIWTPRISTYLKTKSPVRIQTEEGSRIHFYSV